MGSQEGIDIVGRVVERVGKAKGCKCCRGGTRYSVNMSWDKDELGRGQCLGGAGGRPRLTVCVNKMFGRNRRRRSVSDG